MPNSLPLPVPQPLPRHWPRVRTIQARHGISLLEVIACSVILSVIMVQVTDVIRLSGRSVLSSQADVSAHSKAQTALTWVLQSIRDAEILNPAVRGQSITLRRQDGTMVDIALKGQQLLLIDRGRAVVIAENIEWLEFQPVQSRSTPGQIIGTAITMVAFDKERDNRAKLTARVALPPQFANVGAADSLSKMVPK